MILGGEEVKELLWNSFRNALFFFTFPTVRENELIRNLPAGGYQSWTPQGKVTYSSTAFSVDFYELDGKYLVPINSIHAGYLIKENDCEFINNTVQGHELRRKLWLVVIWPDYNSIFPKTWSLHYLRFSVNGAFHPVLG